MEVFLLWHTHIDENLEGGEDSKLIGLYSSAEKAEEAKHRSQLLEGFRDHIDGFLIDRYTIDQDNWTAGFVTIP
ncbi:hypothetical protein LPB86_17915 [Pedobacter sp. MC2016-14]|uniref:DUF7336 domain-containing protein n=1 Tax=Pedobacter sp. MC2016-14 TaxID=2897327 RepID=UPI001E357478|nr:hypothetical protein [Pedobacter sp. MC2016-14]MCD0490122.1 hypothetical protein [Pedobacter sp. MC2016-14]